MLRSNHLSGTFRFKSVLQEFDACLETLSLAVLVDRLSRLHGALEDLRSFVCFDDKGYTRNRIHANELYEVLLLCWKPEQRSPIHDHHGSNCGVVVLAGSATEIRFEPAENGRVKACSCQQIESGAVIASSDSDMHVIANWKEPATELLTLHVYSPPLRKMNVLPDSAAIAVPSTAVKRLPAAMPPPSQPIGWVTPYLA